MTDPVLAELARAKDAPAQFEEPWHATLFALTVKLSENGLFSWPEWTDAFSAHLKAAANAGGLRDGSDYYDHWLATLEEFLSNRDVTSASELSQLKSAWTEAYEQTPHGQPVCLKE